MGLVISKKVFSLYADIESLDQQLASYRVINIFAVCQNILQYKLSL